MTAANLNTIAIDVVGHYGRTAKNLLAVYRAGTERAVKALSAGYGQLIEKQPLPWIDSEIKANWIGSQQRVARLVVDSVARIAERATSAVDSVSGRAVQGLEAFDQSTAWAHDMMVVGAMRRIHLPVARWSLELAGRADEASKRLSQRVAGRAATKTTRAAKTASKRAHRASRKA